MEGKCNGRRCCELGAELVYITAQDGSKECNNGDPSKGYLAVHISTPSMRHCVFAMELAKNSCFYHLGTWKLGYYRI